jgi:hypothetical protein
LFKRFAAHLFEPNSGSQGADAGSRPQLLNLKLKDVFEIRLDGKPTSAISLQASLPMTSYHISQLH